MARSFDFECDLSKLRIVMMRSFVGFSNIITIPRTTPTTGRCYDGKVEAVVMVIVGTGGKAKVGWPDATLQNCCPRSRVSIFETWLEQFSRNQRVLFDSGVSIKSTGWKGWIKRTWNTDNYTRPICTSRRRSRLARCCRNDVKESDCAIEIKNWRMYFRSCWFKDRHPSGPLYPRSTVPSYLYHSSNVITIANS
jgi:hypothetical protein